MKTHHIYTFALLAGAVAVMISGLHSWSEATSPQFIAGVVMAIASVLKGMYQSAPGEVTTADIVKLNRGKQ
jgi:hypothetical protein